MTPFGRKVRELRRANQVTQRRMAADLQVTPAYLSALEHGRRGRPAPGMVMQICAYFDLIWDDAEELKRLAALSHPRVVVDTAGLSPQATRLANLMALHMADLPDHVIDWIIDEVEANLASKDGEPGVPF
ncbi:helix-turn-helix domain-containing protein [Magnetospira sp. QH-2]|uniref:helix-turn-helix domain-containing protein n=1 Tax=Magnetospira sp. (strain QH-2) TaxID=1288970 RepID=UPI0003E812D9|nr:helix-turn-helix domain-containing protein [Magnetospira sp. QH-2]CCQ75632.1 XRE family transcriptional regulator [Magnetospira sp. QH-2]